MERRLDSAHDRHLEGHVTRQLDTILVQFVLEGGCRQLLVPLEHQR